MLVFRVKLKFNLFPCLKIYFRSMSAYFVLSSVLPAATNININSNSNININFNINFNINTNININININILFSD